jgi:hypothetical protein
MSEIMFEQKIAEVLKCMEAAHENYYSDAIFGGPSYFFHRKALDMAAEDDCAGFSEAAYAMLASWGMHRMGPRGSKMRDYGPFAASIADLWPSMMQLRQKSPELINDQDWQTIRGIFFDLRVMQSKSSLVGNSKVMAHALPNLIPPVDRQYTLTFLFGNGNIDNGLENEWAMLRNALKGFFYPLLMEASFTEKVGEWMRNERFSWDTSPLKIIDNLLIGYVRIQRAGRKKNI